MKRGDDSEQAGETLHPCPETPNCVNSEQRHGKSSIEPLPVSGSPAVSWHVLQQALEQEGGRLESDHSCCGVRSQSLS